MSELIEIAERLALDVDRLTFGPPVTHVYNPLLYAQRPHREYLRRYGVGPTEILLLGINPGPWGMAQTGVPFGDVGFVRDFLGIEEDVEKPAFEHPKRPVDGFECPRSEVSGSRLWGWVQERFEKPENFFERFFVWNWCPLSFMEESARNRTPDKLAAEEREPLMKRCDEALVEIVEHLQPTWVIGVGAFAQKQSEKALKGMDVRIGRILHPSPASPKANAGWIEAAEADFKAMGITL